MSTYSNLAEDIRRHLLLLQETTDTLRSLAVKEGIFDTEEGKAITRAIRYAQNTLSEADWNFKREKFRSLNNNIHCYCRVLRDRSFQNVPDAMLVHVEDALRYSTELTYLTRC